MAKQLTKKNTVNKVAPVMRGRVVAAKVPQSVTVLIEREKIHPLYRKGFKRSKRYLVHDPLGAKLGDVVEIVKVKPISKNKHFQLLKVVGQDIVAVVTEQLKEEAQEAIAEVMPVEKKAEEVKAETEEIVEEKKEKKPKKSKKEEKSS